MGKHQEDESDQREDGSARDAVCERPMSLRCTDATGLRSPRMLPGDYVQLRCRVFGTCKTRAEDCDAREDKGEKTVEMEAKDVKIVKTRCDRGNATQGQNGVYVMMRVSLGFTSSGCGSNTARLLASRESGPAPKLRINHSPSQMTDGDRPR